MKLLLVALLLHFPCGAYKYHLSICAIFQNEAPYLKEWIEFHKLVGVEHFYLYNNNSTDHPEKILNPYIKKGIVTLIKWPDVGQVGAQNQAYKHCLKKSEEESKWVAFIDLDEYLFPVEKNNLNTFLKDFEDNPCIAGVCVNWQMYGTSNVASLKPHDLLLDKLRYKGPWDMLGNQHVKTIVRPKYAIEPATPHIFNYKKGYFAVDSNFNRCEEPLKEVVIDKVRINHYWVRTEDYAFSTKLERLMKCYGWTPEDAEQAILNYIELANEEKDYAVKKYIFQLRRNMFQ